MPDHHPAGYTTTQRNGEEYKVKTTHGRGSQHAEPLQAVSDGVSRRGETSRHALVSIPRTREPRTAEKHYCADRVERCAIPPFEKFLTKSSITVESS